MRKRDIVIQGGDFGIGCRDCLGDTFNHPARVLGRAAQAL